MKHWFERILQHGLVRPETPAIVLIDRVVTYGMLHGGVDRCARRLLGLGLPRSGPVAVLVENPIRHLVLCLALHRIGVPSLSLEPGQAGIADIQLAAVLGDITARGLVPPSSRLVEIADDWFEVDPPVTEARSVGFTRSGETCRFTLTSGSTGQPKLLSYTVDEVGMRIAEKLVIDIRASRRAVLCMPGLSSNFGFSTSCAALVGGSTLCFAESPAHAIRMIELFAIDFARMSPEQLLGLTRAAKRTGAVLSSLQGIDTSGNSPSRALLEQALTHVCHTIRCCYGSSETGRMAMADARDVLARPGLVGFVEPGFEAAVFDQTGARCPAGHVGALAVRHVADGGDTAPAAATTDAWTRLGDVGWLDDTGRLYVVGRTTDGNRSSQTISPALEVEHTLQLEWDIGDAAAVVLDEASLDGKPAIWVGLVGCGDASAERLECMMRDRGLDCSIRFFDIAAVPIGANGKVKRGDLKALLLAAAVKTGFHQAVRR